MGASPGDSTASPNRGSTPKTCAQRPTFRELVSAESWSQKVRREWCAGFALSPIGVMVLLLRTVMEKRGMRKASCVLLQLALSAAAARVPAAAIFFTVFESTRQWLLRTPDDDS